MYVNITIILSSVPKSSICPVALNFTKFLYEFIIFPQDVMCPNSSIFLISHGGHKLTLRQYPHTRCSGTVLHWVFKLMSAILTAEGVNANYHTVIRRATMIYRKVN